MDILPAHQSYHRAFTSERVDAAWDAWLAHIERYQKKPDTTQDSRWLQRAVTATGATLPALAHLPAISREISGLWQRVQTGNRLAAMESSKRLTRAAGNSIKTSQSLAEGLQQMFMAYDRYHKARIEAAFKETQADQEQNRFNWHNRLDDLLNDQAYDHAIQQCISTMIASLQETRSRIIANI